MSQKIIEFKVMSYPEGTKEQTLRCIIESDSILYRHIIYSLSHAWEQSPFVPRS